MAVKTQKRQTMQTNQRQPRQSPPKLGDQQQGQVAKVAIIGAGPAVLASAIERSINSLPQFREEMSKPKRKHYIPDGIKVVY